MKYLLLITMLLGIGYSQCNESNWQEYYPDMAYCDLEGANLSGAFFVGANLEGTIFDDANLRYAYFDETGFYGCFTPPFGCDGYDDASYNAGQEDVNVGDMNGDGGSDVLDVVLLVNDILSTP